MTLRARHWSLLALATLALRGPWLLSPGSPLAMGGLIRLAGLDGGALYASAAGAIPSGALPLTWILARGLGALQAWLGGNLGVWLRLPGVAGDLALSLLLYLVVERRSRSSAALAASGDVWRSARAGLMAGLGWALNPLAALLSVGHASWDSLALALLLLAAWCLEYGDDPRSELWAAWCLAAAAALNLWALAFLPLYLGAFPARRERLRFAVWLLLPLLLLALPWCWQDGGGALAAGLACAAPMDLGLGAAWHSAFAAAGAPPEFYGLATALGLGLGWGLLALAWLLALWRCRRLRLAEGLPWAALVLLALLPGLPVTALAWPPALALAVSPRLAWRLGLGGLALLLGHDAFFDPQALVGAAAWAPPGSQTAWLLLWSLVNLGAWLCLLVLGARLAVSVWLPPQRRSY